MIHPQILHDNPSLLTLITALLNPWTGGDSSFVRWCFISAAAVSFVILSTSQAKICPVITMQIALMQILWQAQHFGS